MVKKEKRLTAKDFDQRILELYDHYAHEKITKREFLKKSVNPIHPSTHTNATPH